MSQRIRTAESNDDNKPVWVQVAVSIVFVAAGFAVLLFDLGSSSNDKLAAGWVGAVLGFWLQ